MPTVPVIQQRSVMPDGQVRNPGPYLQQPDFAPAQGLANAAGNVERIAAAAGTQFAVDQQNEIKAANEMRGVTVADAMVQLDKANATRTGSLKQLRGKAAFDASGEVVDGLDADRKAIADTIKDPHARAEFLQRGANTVVAYSHSAESYASEQFNVAQSATAKALENSSLSSLESGVMDFDAWHEVSKRVEQSIKELAPSPEAAEQELLDYRSKSVVAMVSGMLASGKLDEAQAYVEEAKSTLGSRYQETKRAVDRASVGAQKDFLLEQASKLVVGDAEALRNEDGYVTDLDALRKAVDLEEVDESIRPQAEAALEKQIRVEAAKLKADVNKERDNAYRADNVGQAIPGASWDFLQKYDPDFISAWNARKRAEALAWRRERDGSPADRAAAREEQRQLDAEYKDRYAAAVLDNPNLSEADFKVDFIAQKAKQGREITVTDAAEANAGKFGAVVRNKVEKGDVTEDRRIKTEIETLITNTIPAKDRVASRSLIESRTGAALVKLSIRERENGGPLDAGKMAAFKAEIAAPPPKQQVPGRVWGTNTVPGTNPLDAPELRPNAPVLGPTAPATSATVTVRRKSDGKTRTVSQSEASKFLADPNYEQVP